MVFDFRLCDPTRQWSAVVDAVYTYLLTATRLVMRLAHSGDHDVRDLPCLEASNLGEY